MNYPACRTLCPTEVHIGGMFDLETEMNNAKLAATTASENQIILAALDGQ